MTPSPPNRGPPRLRPAGQLTRTGARRLPGRYVGKRGGDAKSFKQAAINDIIVEEAKKGLNVVRLKGGDPGIFGRLGPEACPPRAAPPRTGGGAGGNPLLTRPAPAPTPLAADYCAGGERDRL